jgi:shikimate kinase
MTQSPAIDPPSTKDAQVNAFTGKLARGLAQKLDRPIVLIGLMGTGKSTIGRRIASHLNLNFVDTDHEIERAAQLSVAEIFEQFDEHYFRDGERRVIARLIEEGHGVVATGGGAFINAETRQLLLEKTLCVWLDCDIDTLVSRTSRRETRPLLRDGDPREILTKLQADRAEAYAMAHVHVSTKDAPHHETTMQVLEAIDAWL